MKKKLNHPSALLLLLFIAINLLAFQNCAPSFQARLESGSVNTNATPTGSPSASPVGSPAPSITPSPSPSPGNGSGASPTPTQSPTVFPSPTVTPPQTPTPSAGTKVKAFVASGHLGRTIMSCDDGRTWVHDRSDNPTGRCWVDGPNYVECDHTPNSGRGLDYNDGWFFANYGWGAPGSVRRSTNGKDWQITMTGGSGGGIAYVLDRLLVLWHNNTGSWSVSEDQGQSFQILNSQPEWDEMGHPQLRRLNQKMIAYGRPAGRVRIMISRDGARTWTRIGAVTPTWQSNLFAEGNGILISTGNEPVLIRSTDDGENFTTHPFPHRVFGLAHNGTGFFAWGEGRTFRSIDGINWTTTTAMVGTSPMPVWYEGSVAYNSSTNTFVLIQSTWGRYYSNQEAMWSQDGVNWTRGQFPSGHPITAMVLGEVLPADCR